MESIWKERLIEKNWSPRAAQQIQFCLAPSTLRIYNNNICKLQQFCELRNIQFPPTSSGIIADFLCSIADSSSRPRSALNVAHAAITFYFRITNQPNPCDQNIGYLMTALVKSGTVSTIKKPNILPAQPFTDLFTKLGDNEKMSLKDLRMKTIVLLAFAFMLRPSDIAPKSVVYDGSTGDVTSLVFNTNNIRFEDNGNLTIVFHGIKNDLRRDGFVTTIPSLDNSILDPVRCLKMYIERTDSVRPTDSKPVFISLSKPFKALSASSIGQILQNAIKMAGLDSTKYSAKSFRPTGATRAIEAGLDANKCRRVGRWASEDCFFTHYVHDKTPAMFTEKVLKP